MQADADRAALRLAPRDALLGRLDAVHDRVAQHVLERRQHALQHLAVQLAGRADDDQLGLLARVGRDLPHQAAEALHVALERHHARAHQAVLQFGDDARLLQQQVLRFARQVLEQAFDAADVADRLGERARQLLDRRIAVELQRIEVGATRMLFLVPMQDLRFGLQLQLAQLLFQARHGAAELGEVELDRADLLLQPRAEDADFAGVVEQRVEQVGVDAREFLAFLRLRLAARQRQCGLLRRGLLGSTSDIRIGRQLGRQRGHIEGRLRGGRLAAGVLFDTHRLARRGGTELVRAELDVELGIVELASSALPRHASSRAASGANDSVSVGTTPSRRRSPLPAALRSTGTGVGLKPTCWEWLRLERRRQRPVQQSGPAR